jgi:hypothetical protein
MNSRTGRRPSTSRRSSSRSSLWPIIPATSNTCSRFTMAVQPRRAWHTRLIPSRRFLSNQLVAAWTDLAWTGNPNGVGNFPWPRYQGTRSDSYYLLENILPAGLSRQTDEQFAAKQLVPYPLSPPNGAKGTAGALAVFAFLGTVQSRFVPTPPLSDFGLTKSWAKVDIIAPQILRQGSHASRSNEYSVRPQ